MIDSVKTLLRQHAERIPRGLPLGIFNRLLMWIQEGARKQPPCAG